MASVNVSDQVPCPACGSHNRPGAQYCGQCGISFAGSSLDDFQPKAQLSPDRQAPLTESSPIASRKQQPEKRTGIALGAVIVSGLGCLLVVAGSSGLMSGDTVGLILWIPGIILGLIGFAMTRRAKK